MVVGKIMQDKVALIFLLIVIGAFSLDLRSSGSVGEPEKFYEDLHAEGRNGYIRGALEELDAAAILQAAEYGFPEAQCALGTMCEEGIGGEANETAAAEWYLQSAKNGYVGGMYNLGTLYLRGGGVEKNVDEAVLWFKKAAEQLCDPEGFCRRHFLSRVRVGDRELRLVRDDASSMDIAKVVDVATNDVIWEQEQSEEALASLLAGAEAFEDDVVAMKNLPHQLLSMWGQDAGFDVDSLLPHGGQYTKGVVDFEKATAWAGGPYGQRDDTEALAGALMSFMMRRGQEDLAAETEFLAQDPAWTMLLERLVEGVQGGDGRMAAVLGVLQRAGFGMPQDQEAACKLFAFAAEKGVAEGACNLGVCYERGVGVGKDERKAAGLYKQAAERCPRAKANYAGMLQRGAGGLSGNPAEAVRLYREAAKEGDAAAMNNLGVLFATGEGVEQDVVEAVRWLRKAVEVPSGVFVLSEKHAMDNKDKSGAQKDLGDVPGRNSPAAALYNLGLLHEAGLGVAASGQAAARWLALATEKALRDAGNDEGLLI